MVMKSGEMTRDDRRIRCRSRSSVNLQGACDVTPVRARVRPQREPQTMAGVVLRGRIVFTPLDEGGVARNREEEGWWGRNVIYLGII